MPSSTSSFSCLASCLPTFKSLSKEKIPPRINPRLRYDAQVRSALPAYLSNRAESDPALTPPTIPRARLAPPRRNSLDADQSPTPNRTRNARPFPTSVASGSSNTSASRKDPRDTWSTSSLSDELLAELFTTIHTTLYHVPYAICGLGALVDQGYTSRRSVTQISILCPAYAKDNVRAWLASRGYDTYGDSVGIPVGRPGRDGKRETRRVRIRYLDEGFDRLERVRSQCSDAWVLGLASQLDHAAAGFVEHFRRLKLQHEGQNGIDDDTEQRALHSIARDIFFMLDRAVLLRHPLDPGLLPTLLGEEFWSPFTRHHEDARTQMAKAGIDVAAVLERHRDELAVREHEEMLRQFGAIEGVALDRPGPFEGMRVLGDETNTKSVYSVESSAAASYIDKGKGKEKELPSVPPVPHLPSHISSRLPTRLPMPVVPERSSSSRPTTPNRPKKSKGKGTYLAIHTIGHEDEA